MINFIFGNIVKIICAAKVPEEQIESVKSALELSNRLRRVWKTTFPEETCPEELRSYEATAKELEQLFCDTCDIFPGHLKTMCRVDRRCSKITSRNKANKSKISRQGKHL